MKTSSGKFVLVSGIGRGAFIFGAVCLIMAASLFYIQAFATASVLTVIGLLLISFRVQTEIDKEKKTITRKTGLFVAFIPRMQRSIDGTRGVVLTRHPTHFDFLSNVKARSSYILSLEHPDGDIPIEYFDDHELGYHEGHTLARWLGVRFHQNVIP